MINLLGQETKNIIYICFFFKLQNVNELLQLLIKMNKFVISVQHL